MREVRKPQKREYLKMEKERGRVETGVKAGSKT